MTALLENNSNLLQCSDCLSVRHKDSHFFTISERFQEEKQLDQQSAFVCFDLSLPVIEPIFLLAIGLRVPLFGRESGSLHRSSTCLVQLDSE